MLLLLFANALTHGVEVVVRFSGKFCADLAYLIDDGIVKRRNVG